VKSVNAWITKSDSDDTGAAPLSASQVWFRCYSDAASLYCGVFFFVIMAHSFSEVFVNGNPYLESLGVVVLEYGDGRASMALPLRPEFMNSWHVAQGGISMTLMDVAMGLAARTAVAGAQSSATVDMSSSFLRPAGKSGDTIVAHGRVYHCSTTMCFCDAELWNGDLLVAKAMGTFKAIRRVDLAKKLVPAGSEGKQE
jgi:acyl-CoA thioesterase